MTTYKPEDVQMQVFCDNSCTEWAPNGAQLLALNDKELAENVRNIVQRAILMRQEFDGYPTRKQLEAFGEQLDEDYPIKVKS